MKIILLALLAATGLQTASAETTPTLSAPEQTLIADKAGKLLHKAIQFEADGSAFSHFVRRQRTTRVEWRNLVFRQLILGTVSKKDRQRGVSRRIYAQLGSDAYRLMDTEGVGPWRSGHCPGLPGFIVAEEIDGEFVVSSPELAKFHKTPKPHPTRPDKRALSEPTVVSTKF